MPPKSPISEPAKTEKKIDAKAQKKAAEPAAPVAASALTRIQSTGYVQWDIYNIVRDAFCPYRGIRVETAKITREEFIKNMRYDLFVKIVGVSAAGEKLVIAILNRDESGGCETVTQTDRFRVFYNTVREGDMARLITISPVPYSTHPINYINEKGIDKHLDRYSYDHVKVVIPLGPYCMPHTILTEEEAVAIRGLHKDIKKIHLHDPQIIWLGATVDQIVRIDRINPLTGLSTDYRCVVV